MSIAVDQKKWGPDYVQGVAPSNPSAGQTWYDNINNLLKIYNYLDTADNIQDLSASDHDVSRFGGVITTRLGNEIVGPCSVAFNGTSSYLSIPDHADWDFGTGDFTIDFWIKRSVIGVKHVVMGHNGATWGTADSAWYVQVETNNKIRFGVSNGSTNYNLDTTTTIDNTNWNHIVCLRNGNTNKVYINGGLDSTTLDVTGFTIQNVSEILGIGRPGDFNGAYHDGNLDEIRISKGIDRTTDSNDLLYIDGGHYGNSGTIYVDNFQTITAWTDQDSGDGASTLSAFDGTDGCFKLDSGTAGAGNKAQRLIDCGTISDKFVVTIKTYCDKVGTLGDHLQVEVRNPDVSLTLALASDGLYIHDGSGWNEVGTNVIVQDIWQEWEFVIDGTTPASATCDVYLDGTKIATSVDCSRTGTWVDGSSSCTTTIY